METDISNEFLRVEWHPNDSTALSLDCETGFHGEEKICVAAVNLVKEKDLEPWRRQRAPQGRAGGEKNQENNTVFHENPEANVGSLACSQSWSE